MPFLGVQPSRGLVGTAGIDADAITSAKIADDQIDSEHYAAGSIDTAHIAANQIDGTLTKDALIADYSDVTITASDLIMYGDATDSNNSKRDTVQGILDLVPSAGMTLGSPQGTSDSTTAHTFGSIPTGTKLILINYRAFVKNSGGSDLAVQIGDSGGLETSGYLMTTAYEYGSAATMESVTSYFVVDSSFGTAAIDSGVAILSLLNSSTNHWSYSVTGKRDAVTTLTGGGDKALSGELTQLKFYTTAGAWTAGEVNISYM